MTISRIIIKISFFKFTIFPNCNNMNSMIKFFKVKNIIKNDIKMKLTRIPQNSNLAEKSDKELKEIMLNDNISSFSKTDIVFELIKRKNKNVK